MAVLLRLRKGSTEKDTANRVPVVWGMLQLKLKDLESVSTMVFQLSS